MSLQRSDQMENGVAFYTAEKREHTRKEWTKKEVMKMNDTNKISKKLGFQEILESRNLSESDKLKMLINSSFLSDKSLHMLACQFAKQACKLIFTPHRSIAEIAIQTKHDWINGKASREDVRKWCEKINFIVKDKMYYITVEGKALDGVYCAVLFDEPVKAVRYASETVGNAFGAAAYEKEYAAWGELLQDIKSVVREVGKYAGGIHDGIDWGKGHLMWQNAFQSATQTEKIIRENIETVAQKKGTEQRCLRCKSSFPWSLNY